MKKQELLNLNKKSGFYSALKWLYQPIKSYKALVRNISYIPRRTALIKKFVGAEFVGLHIGCGPFRMDGWINTDLPPNPHMDFPLDITRPLPFPENYFHAIYASEVIEHVTLQEFRLFLHQALKILKPGGVFRLTTPDLEKICHIYLHQHHQITPADFGKTWLDGEFSDDIWINAMFHSWGHQFLYSFRMLEKEMQTAGFNNIIRVEPMVTKSPFKQLDSLEGRYGDDAPKWIFEKTMLIEASKATV